jgi:hypothetical protein
MTWARQVGLIQSVGVYHLPLFDQREPKDTEWPITNTLVRMSAPALSTLVTGPHCQRNSELLSSWEPTLPESFLILGLLSSHG